LLKDDAIEKLPVTQRIETDLAARTRGFEEEMRESYLKLAKIRDNLKSLVENRDAVTCPSGIRAQLKALIGEQQIRINRFTWLEIKLAKINYKLQIDKIRRDKWRWLGHLMDYNIE